MHTDSTEAYEAPTVTDVSDESGDGPSTVCAMVSQIT
jgi:hypothetical protein